MITNHVNRSRLVIGVAVFLALTAILVAGEMDPWAPPGPTMKQLDHIEPRIPLHAEMFPVTINAPGSYYLTGNVTASGGIAIAANDVTIDLNGFALEGVGGGIGIQTIAEVANLTVQNGVVRGWSLHGLQIMAERSVVERVIVSNNGDHGIWVGNQALIVDCQVSDNAGAGIQTGDRSVVRNSIVNNNQAIGIQVGIDSVVESCMASGNWEEGIQTLRGGIVADSIAIDNLYNGILVGSPGGTVTNCVTETNAFTGIRVGDGAVVRGCTAEGNGLGGLQVGAGTLVEKCTARNNLNHGIVVGHGSTVRNCTVRENETHGVYATYGVDVIGNNCSRNGSAVGGFGAGIYADGVDNRIDGNLVLSNDRGIEVSVAGNTVVRNSASGNGDDYGAIAGGNDVGPIGTAATATSPWANIQF